MRRRFPLLLSCGLLAGSLAWAQGPNTNGTFNTLPNETSTGTTLFYLAKKVPGGPGALAQLVLPSLSDTQINLYPIVANAGKTGSALYITAGDASCIFDSTTTGKGGKWVVPSATTPGQCHETDTFPANGMVVGTLTSDNTTAGQPAQIDVQNQNFIPGSGAGTGTVTSVGLTLSGIPEFTVSGSPVTVAGAITLSKANQAANLVYASPNGSTGPPTFRALVTADLPGTVPTGSCGGDLAGTFPNCLVTKSSTTWALTGGNASTISGQADNFSPTGFLTTNVQLINGGAGDRDMTGLAAMADGSIQALCNNGTTNALTLKPQHTGSAAANRLDILDDVTLLPTQCAPLRYHGTPQRWRLVSVPIPDYLKLRPATMSAGDPQLSSPPLAVGNNSPAGWTNMYRRPYKITAMACFGNSGASKIRAVFRGQADTSTSILTGDCTCGNGAFAPCTLNGNPIVNAAAGAGVTCTTTPCTIDMNIVVADGTTQYIAVNMEGLLQ